MKIQLNVLGALLIVSSFLSSCRNNAENKDNNSKDSTALAKDSVNGVDGQTSMQGKDPLEFCPTGYAVIDKIQGDLNKDGVDD